MFDPGTHILERERVRFVRALRVSYGDADLPNTGDRPLY